jgi:hypothetical protein
VGRNRWLYQGKCHVVSVGNGEAQDCAAHSVTSLSTSSLSSAYYAGTASAPPSPYFRSAVPPNSSSDASTTLLQRVETVTSEFGFDLSGISFSKFGKLVLQNLDRVECRGVELEIVNASESDRPEERIENIFSISRCKTIMRETRVSGFNAQARCGCAMNRPCYYSSRPSVSPNSEEFVSCRIFRPHVIYAFTVTPYQAFFQPGSPVFAPKAVRLEIKLHDHSADRFVVVYVSREFEVTNEFRTQFFRLESPILLSSNFLMTVVFVGKQQRQPIDGNDEYYTCISNMKLLGVELCDDSLDRLPLSPSTFTNAGIVLRSTTVAEQYAIPLFSQIRGRRDSQPMFSVFQYSNDQRLDDTSDAKDFIEHVKEVMLDMRQELC